MGRLECVTERAEELVTVVLHLDGLTTVGERNGLTRHIVNVIGRILLHEGIEVTVAHLVLVGQVKTELVHRKAHTCSQPVGSFPVRIVCRRGVIDAWRRHCLVAHGILLIDGRYVVVTQSQSHVIAWLELSTQLQGRYALERLLCQSLHNLIAAAVVILRAAPLIIGVTIDGSHVASAVVSILIDCSQSQVVANRVSCRDAELPRRIETEFLCGRLVIDSRADGGVIVGRELIERWRRESSTDTEGRLLERTDNGTGFDGVAISRQLQIVGNQHLRMTLAVKLLEILAIAVIVHTIDANGQTPVESVDRFRSYSPI